MLKPRPEVYETYWYFAAERQNIFFNRLQGIKPLTADPILQQYKFCNAYRASDRVSQFLIKEVIYKKQFESKDLLMRILLFRLLNKVETWQYLEQEVGEVSWQTFDHQRYSALLNRRRAAGNAIYGNAFILCANKAFGFAQKHDNHLALLNKIFSGSEWEVLLTAQSLQELFNLLKEQPLIGSFMAYQLAIDLNYSELFNFSENEFTAAGPGALRGIKKVFISTGSLTPQQIIMWMVEHQEEEFSKQGLKFRNLFGRPLQAIDCQNLFCEVDKYSRVKFPKLTSNRTVIKAKYAAMPTKISYFYPPKWQLSLD